MKNLGSAITELINTILSPTEPPMRWFDDYDLFMTQNSPSVKDLESQRSTTFEKSPVITVIISGEGDIEASTESLVAQTYRAFEVCIIGKSTNKKPNKHISDRFIVFQNDDYAEVLDKIKKNPTNRYVVFMQAGDILAPNALYELVMCINKTGADVVYSDEDLIKDGARNYPTLKSSMSPELIMSYNYIGGMLAVSGELFNKITSGKENMPENEYEYSLRATLNAIKTEHIPKVLYTRGRKLKTDPTENRRCVMKILNETGAEAIVTEGLWKGSLRVRRNVPEKTRASIIILAGSDVNSVRRCLESIEGNTLGMKYSVIVAHSVQGDNTFLRYMTALKNSKAAQVIRYEMSDSRSKILNDCIQRADGDLIAVMKSDYEVLTPDWLISAAEFALCEDIGLVGGKIVTLDNRIVQTGLVIGLKGWWGTPYFGEQDISADRTEAIFNSTVRNVTLPGVGCFFAKREKIINAGGFDESINGECSIIELGMRLLNSKMRNVYTPFIKLRCMGEAEENNFPNSDDEVRMYDVLRSSLKSGDKYFSPDYDTTNKNGLRLRISENGVEKSQSDDT